MLLRERISPLQMCDNGAATVLQELVSLAGGTPTYATTNMTLNQYGDYALVMAPPGADGVRYTVRYTYDADRHSNVAVVEEFDVADADAADVLANGAERRELDGGHLVVGDVRPAVGPCRLAHRRQRRHPQPRLRRARPHRRDVDDGDTGQPVDER